MILRLLHLRNSLLELGLSILLKLLLRLRYLLLILSLKFVVALFKHEIEKVSGALVRFAKDVNKVLVKFTVTYFSRHDIKIVSQPFFRAQTVIQPVSVIHFRPFDLWLTGQFRILDDIMSLLLLHETPSLLF